MSKEQEITVFPLQEIPNKAEPFGQLYGHYLAATVGSDYNALVGLVSREATVNNGPLYHFMIKGKFSGKRIISEGNYKTSRDAYDACISNMKYAYELDRAEAWKLLAKAADSSHLNK